jgi:hypothetical protein
MTAMNSYVPVKRDVMEADMLIKRFLLLCFFFYSFSILGTGSGLAAENLKPLAGSAGDYAAWADACGDPVGATVRSDFLSRAKLLSSGKEARVIKRFENRYKRKKSYADRVVEKCVLQGKTDCCSAVPSVAGRFDKAKSIYETGLQKLASTAPSTESSGSGTEGPAVTPTSSSRAKKQSDLATQQQAQTQSDSQAANTDPGENSGLAAAESKYHSDLHFVLLSREQLDLRLLQLDPTAIQSDSVVYNLARQMYGQDSTPGGQLSEFDRKSKMDELRNRILNDARDAPNKFAHHAKINLGEFDPELGGFPITPGASVGLNKSSHALTGWELSTLESCDRMLCFKAVMHPDSLIAPVKITNKNAMIKVLKMSQGEAQTLLQSMKTNHQGRNAHVIIGFSIDKVDVLPKTRYTLKETYLAYLNILSADIYSDVVIRKNETRIDGHLSSIPLTGLDDVLAPGEDYDRVEVHATVLPLYLPKMKERYASGDMLLQSGRFSKPIADIGPGAPMQAGRGSLFRLSLNRLNEMLLLKSGYDHAADLTGNNQANAYLGMMANHLRDRTKLEFESEFDRHAAVDNFKTMTVPLLKKVPTKLPIKMLRVEHASLGQYDFNKSGFPMSVMARFEQHDVFPGKLEGLPDFKAMRFLPMDMTRAKTLSDRLNNRREVYVAQELTISKVLPMSHGKPSEEPIGKHESLVIYFDKQLTEPLHRF